MSVSANASESARDYTHQTHFKHECTRRKEDGKLSYVREERRGLRLSREERFGELSGECFGDRDRLRFEEGLREDDRSRPEPFGAGSGERLERFGE